jgi:DNA-binding MarR family transcriptional regulator
MLTALVSRLHRRLREVGHIDEITPSQGSVLARLVTDGPASVSDLARAERIRPQSMAKIVGALEITGFVERQPYPDDGRRQLIRLAGVHQRSNHSKSTSPL